MSQSEKRILISTKDPDDATLFTNAATVTTVSPSFPSLQITLDDLTEQSCDRTEEKINP